MKKKIIIIILTITIAIVGIPKTKAQTLTPYDTYYQQMELDNYSNMGTTSRFSCQLVPSSVSGSGPYDTGLINRDYTSNVYMFDFAFNTSLSANTYYDIVLNNSKATFTTKINNNTVTFNNGTSISNLYDSSNNNAITLISATRNSNKKITIRIFVGRATSLWSLHIVTDSGQDKLTSGTQWNISSISMESVDVSGTDAIVDNNNANTNSIINNQQENTQNIINNQQENTQELINNQNELLGTKCDNKIDLRNWITSWNSGGIITTINGQKLSASGTGSSTSSNIGNESNTFNINLQAGKTYYFTINKTMTTPRIYFRYKDGNNWQAVYSTGNSVSFTPTNNVTQAYLFNGGYTNGTVISYENIEVSVTEKKHFCSYGTYLSKQDETTNSINNLNDTMSQNHSYNNNSSETIQGQQDIDNMQNKENQILNNIDLTGANNLDITIDGNASNFIWIIAQKLREMSSKIVLLFTSILGIGIMKTVLNR